MTLADLSAWDLSGLIAARHVVMSEGAAAHLSSIRSCAMGRDDGGLGGAVQAPEAVEGYDLPLEVP
ncbi:MAG: hypothetical protein ACK4RN_15500 [Pseudorhodobacter sp.]